VPTSFLLATEDKSLLASWTSQTPAQSAVLTLGEIEAYPRLPPGMPIVVVLDAVLADRIPSFLNKCPFLVVGRPHSALYEQLRMAGKAHRCMSYEESRERLGDFLPLMAQVAEQGAVLEMVIEKSLRAAPSRPPFSSGAGNGSPEIWDFLEGAVESMGSRERLLSEFRRASRHVLQASHAVFFLREENEFRADRGSSSCPASDPLIVYLSTRPVVLDGVDWPGPSDPLAEMAARNRMALWGARLLVPLHDNGRLVGMIACGVRNDGQAYDEADKARAISFARLLRQLLSHNQHHGRLDRLYERSLIGERYFPDKILLDPTEEPSREVPLAVRALLGKARHQRATQHLRPEPGQPFRASAGVVAETGGTWAFWEEASSEIEDHAQEQRVNRLALLRDLALTLNHEIGNTLVSLSALQKGPAVEQIPADLQKMVSGDVDRLKKLNKDLGQLAEFSEMTSQRVDLRDVLKQVGAALELKIEVPPDAVELEVVSELIHFALDALVRTVAENQPSNAEKLLTVQLRSTGEGAELTALISIQGSGLELEGILPDPGSDETPNQGRLTVFIAKEILRLHDGEIHAGPGLAGTEILLSLRRW
jgi:hypothetical protein